MSARIRQMIGSEHRAEVSRDERTGRIWFRLRRHKRGSPVNFTSLEWWEFIRAVKAGELDWLAQAAAGLVDGSSCEGLSSRPGP